MSVSRWRVLVLSVLSAPLVVFGLLSLAYWAGGRADSSEVVSNVRLAGLDVGLAVVAVLHQAPVDFAGVLAGSAAGLDVFRQRAGELVQVVLAGDVALEADRGVVAAGDATAG